MLVTVLIANHDYGRFLPETIDAALGQTHRKVEVVVVDDGSTDDSVEILRGYGDRIVVIEQERAGQAAALNAGFERSRGELICLLDADDVFEADKVASVVAAWRAGPGACLVHHQMRTVDAAGSSRDAPWPRQVAIGDLRPVVRRTAGWYPRAPTSALAFPRAYLERLFPIPTGARVGTGPLGEATVELKPDTYLAAPAAFLGPVAGVARPLTRYRIHGANKSGAGVEGSDARASLLNRRIVQYLVEAQALRESLDRLGHPTEVRLESHLEYQIHRRGLREASVSEAVLRTLRCPALPPAGRVREAARVAAGRGYAKPVLGRSSRRR